MTDLALIIEPESQLADIGFGGDFTTDDGLRTAILASVWTDARATDDDLRRFGYEGADPRGFWADSIVPAVADDNTGSLLWLLARAKQTEETRRIARDMVAAALNWLVDDKLAKSIEVIAQWRAPGVLAWRASILKPDGKRFDVEWQASLKEIA